MLFFRPMSTICHKRICLSFLTVFLFVAVVSLAAREINKNTLENGLTVITLEDHRSPLVAVQVSYRVGLGEEPPGLSGITEVCREIMTAGTKTFSHQDYSRLVQGTGGIISSYMTFDYTQFRARFPASLLDSVLMIEADRMANTEMSFEKLLLARENVRKSWLTTIENDFYGPAHTELLRLTFRRLQYRHPRLGWPNEVEQLGLDDVKKYYRTYFQPANAVIVIAGDFKTEKTVARIGDLFGGIQAVPVPPRRRLTEPLSFGETRAVLPGEVGVGAILVGYRVPSVLNNDIAALRLLNRIVSGGDASRLNRALVNETETAMRTGGNIYTLMDGGLLYFWAILNYDVSPGDGERQLLAEIDRLKAGPVSEAELIMARNRQEFRDYELSRSLDNLVSRLSFLQLERGDCRLIDEITDIYTTVTVADLQRVARQYLVPSNRTVILVDPEFILEEDE